MNLDQFPRVKRSASAPDIVDYKMNDSPRSCERCNKIAVLIRCRLNEKINLVLYVCQECQYHYTAKALAKGRPLSPRDLISPRE